MANILFKRGLKANLSAATITDGNVYVTTDEGAMYVDVGNSRVRLGDFKEYSTFSALQALNTNQLDTQALYYITDGNMLIKWTGNPNDSNGGWVQINSQASLTNLIGSVKTSGSAVTGGVSVTQTIRDNTTATVATSNLNFVSADVDKLKITSAMDSGNNYAILTFTPEDIVENAAISVSNDQVNNNTAILTITNNKTGTDASGQSVSTTGTSSTLSITGDGISVTEDNGALVLTNLGGVDAVRESFDANGVLSVNILLTTGDTIPPSSGYTVTPTITYGESGASSAVFASGTAALSVYTQTEVDNKIAAELKAINAMTYKGSIGNNIGDVSADLPTSNVHNGDVYKVSENGSFGNGIYTNCHIGDMFIAVGTEGNDGVIPSANLTWSYIPSGDDEASQYSLQYDSTNHTIIMQDQDHTSVGVITAGNDIVFGGTGSNITLGHNTVTRTNTTGTATTQTSGNDLTFSVVTGITTSSTGHITGVETTSITVTDSSNYLTGVSNTVGTLSGTGSNTQITVSVADNVAGSVTTDIKLHSDSLTFSRDTTNNITNIDFVWGSF